MRVHHLALRTRNVSTLVAFYETQLGLVATKRNARSTWLDAGGTIVMIERCEAHAPPVNRESF